MGYIDNEKLYLKLGGLAPLIKNPQLASFTTSFSLNFSSLALMVWE